MLSMKSLPNALFDTSNNNLSENDQFRDLLEKDLGYEKENQEGSSCSRESFFDVKK